MSGDEAPIVSASPLMRVLWGVRKVIVSKASPIADAVLFFFLVFLLSVAGHTFQDVYGTRQLAESFKNRLLGVVDTGEASRWPTSNVLNHVYFKDISTHQDFWDYVQHNLADTIYPVQFYDGQDYPANQLNLVMGHNVMVQKVRIRQKRVKPIDCKDVPLRLNTETEAGLKNRKCYPRFSAALEDTDDYAGVEWKAAEMLKLRPRNPLQHKFQGGSYSIELPQGNAAFKQKVQELKDKRWTDQATRAVFIDFCVINLARDQFVSLRFEFDFTEYGKIVPKSTIRAYKDRLSHDLFTDALNYISESALYGIVGANAFREFGRMRVVGPKVYFSNIWNLMMGGLLACCFLSMNYRVGVVRAQWSEIQTKAGSSMKWQLDSNRQYNIEW